MQYFSIALEFFSLLVLFTLFSVGVGLATVIICKKNFHYTWNNIRPVLLEYFIILFMLQCIALIIWSQLLDRYINFSDPWLVFFVFLPVDWRPIFEGSSLAFYEPRDPLFTTGQIANWYYATIFVISLISMIITAARNRSQILNQWTVLTVIFTLQIIILTATSIF